MRAGQRYLCPKCKAFEFPVTCLTCGIMPVDEHGNEPPPLVQRRKVSEPGFLKESTDAGAPFRRLAAAMGELTAMQRLRWVMPKRPVGLVDRGGQQWLGIRGKVRLIESVSFEGARFEQDFIHDLACFRVRQEMVEAGRSVAKPGLSVEIHQGCGRFVIVGEEHEVVVDEDFLQVLPARGDSYRSAEVLIRDGDVIEAFGPVRSCSVAEMNLGAFGGGRGGYRGGQQMLRFDGSTQNMVHLRPVGASAKG